MEKSAFQDHFRHIPGPSTNTHTKPSSIPILSKPLFPNSTNNKKHKSQKCYKGVSCIPVPQGRKKYTSKSTTKDNACNISDTSSVCDPLAMPRDTTTMNRAHNSQGDTKANTPDQHPNAPIQPHQDETSKPIIMPSLLPTQSSQNAHHHKSNTFQDHCLQ